MQSSLSRNILSATITVAFLAACAGSGNGGVPSAASPFGAAQSRVGQEAASGALSGEYSGKYPRFGVWHVEDQALSLAISKRARRRPGQ